MHWRQQYLFARRRLYFFGFVSLPISEDCVGPWHEAHPWSPWRVLGFDLWRWAVEDPHGVYVYKQHGRSQRVAREMLHSMYGDKTTDEWVKCKYR